MAYRKQNPDSPPLSEFLEEMDEKVNPASEPEKEWPVYGVNNKIGVFFSHNQKGIEFNSNAYAFDSGEAIEHIAARGRPGYPKDMRECRQQVATNAACLAYLVRCRWTDGFVCPQGSGKSAWLNSTRYVFECRSCGRQTSPIAGTIMPRSHVPVQEWFGAAD